MRTAVAVTTAALLAALSWFVLTQRTTTDAAPGHSGASIAADDSSRPPVARPTVSPTSAAPTPSSTVVRSVPNRCMGNRGQEVLVSLALQRLWMCNGHVAVAGFAVTTGRHVPGDRTPTGTYAVQARTRDTTLDPSSGGAFHVKYWIPFKLGVWGFHDAPWQTIAFGSQRYRTGGSQGCVHMRTKDIARLFAWVQLGTRVRIVRGA